VLDIGAESVVFFGFSVTLLRSLATSLPPRSVVVVEEPDAVRDRDIPALAATLPAVSRVIAAEYQDPAGLAALLDREPAITRAHAVVPGLEYAVEAAAHVADLLHLRGAGRAAASAVRDKYRLRGLAGPAGVRNPPYALVGTVAEAERFFRRAGRPCVLKPTSRQASAGVQIIRAVDQIAVGWALSADPDEGSRGPARGGSGPLLMEHALVGPEYSVELLVDEGRPVFVNVTAKQVLPGRFPVEIGHVVPAPVDPDLAGRLRTANERLISATGFGTGIMHSEWIVEDGTPTLVECAARMPGDEISQLVSLAYDVPFVERYLCLLLGQRPTLPAAAVRGAAIRFLTAESGDVVAVEGTADAERVPGVVTVRMTATPGARYAAVTSSWDRAGYVLACGEDARAADRSARAGADRIAVAVRAPLAVPAG
jgi:biotin carboxylase